PVGGNGSRSSLHRFWLSPVPTGRNGNPNRRKTSRNWYRLSHCKTKLIFRDYPVLDFSGFTLYGWLRQAGSLCAHYGGLHLVFAIVLLVGNEAAAARMPRLPMITEKAAPWAAIGIAVVNTTVYISEEPLLFCGGHILNGRPNQGSPNCLRRIS